jgi:hypothetical protein
MNFEISPNVQVPQPLRKSSSSSSQNSKFSSSSSSSSSSNDSETESYYNDNYITCEFGKQRKEFSGESNFLTN